MTFTDEIRKTAIGYIAILRDETTNIAEKKRCREALRLLKIKNDNIADKFDMNKNLKEVGV